MAKVIVITKGLTALSHELSDKWITIGRADGNTFQVAEDSVSGRHCEVRLKGAELLIRDLQSTNGTFVNGQKISEATVKSGQNFRLGEVELRFEKTADLPNTAFTSKMLMANAAAMTSAKPLPPSVAVAEVKENTAPDTTVAAAKKHYVLFVDDSLAFLETFTELCTALSAGAWDIQTANSADRALAILQAKPISLVVLDVGMPMVDGLQLVGIIKRRHPEIKIAVMTGNATEAKRTDALANGAELFLEKPVTSHGIQSVFNLLNDLVVWASRENINHAPAQVTATPETPPSASVNEHAALGEDFVVVATYDGQWNKVDAPENNPPC